MKNGNMMKVSMKLGALSFAVLLTGCLSSCVREAGAPVLKPAGEEMVFTASWVEEQGSRTVVMENGTDIWWTPGESIHIFYGDASAQFTSVNKDTVACTSFYGILGVATGTMEQENPHRPFIGVYPYRESNTCDGESVSIEVAYEQQACAGTFADKFFPAVARSTSLDLAFYNVCGGVRFSIVHEGVNRVVFHSLDSCSMAGKVKVGFDDDNKPLILQCTESVDSVVVYAPAGGFIPGENYFAAFIPQEHAKGISVSLYAGLKKAYGEIAHPICVKRSVFGIRDAIDEGWEYVGPDLPPFIDFADSVVKRICVENFDLDGDGEVNYEEAASVDSLKTLFQNNREIRLFNELAYFTGLSEIQKEAFLNCSNLEEVVLPDGLVTIGESAFTGCSSLRKIDLSACTLLKTIGASAFKNAVSEDIVIPAAVNSIGSMAFAKIKYVRLLSVIPPTITSDTFNASARYGVPAESLKRYKTKKLSGTIWGKRVNWIYSNDTFSYPPSLVDVSPTRKRLNLFGYTLDFIKVSPGSYSEGGNSVTITEAFWLSETEFTRALWMAVKYDDPSFFQPTMEEGMNCPLTNVTWEGVNAFIPSLKELVPGNYHLPTEAQWRFAAKGGTSSRSYTYSGSNTVGNVAWYKDNSECCLDTTGARRQQPHPVKSKADNELGFYDMSGNVAEWVSDYYSTSMPKGTDPTGPKSDSENRRVTLGGDYLTADSGCKIAYRYYAKQDVLRANVGFRLAL